MNINDLANLIKSRRSIRVWQDKKVPEEMLLQAIELATHAPNAGNQQNWRFYLILDQKVIRSIADAVQASADYISSWPEMSTWPEAAVRMLQKASFFRDAPAAIAVTASQYQSPIEKVLAAHGGDDPKVALMRQGRAIANSKIQSVSSAIAYLLLVLHQMGLGAVWMTGPMQAKMEIEKILKVPEGKDLVAFIPIGYPAESPEKKERKPVRDVCEVIK